MIPSTNSILSTNLKVERQPTKTYKFDIENNVINGFCDNLEAMTQVVYKILNTERYKSIMYSWNYGIELLDLFGEPINYAVSELKRRITEALVQDDRIQSVDNFEYKTDRRTVYLSFTVHTIYGDVQSEKVVNV
jgi:phage baseplate assembly protein W